MAVPGLLALGILTGFLVASWKQFGFGEWVATPGTTSAPAAAPAEASAERMAEIAAPAPPPIIIDAGHGGADGGTVWNGVIEKHVALAVSEIVRDRLEALGYPVVMTRETDETLELSERSAFANAAEGRIFVSIHFNSGPAQVTGIESFYSAPRSVSVEKAVRDLFGASGGQAFEDQRPLRLAEAIQAAACAATGARDRGARNREGLSVTRHTVCPAVLVECGFLTNPGEAARAADPAYQEKLAGGIVDGVVSYLEKAALDPMFGVLLEEPAGADVAGN